MADRQWFANSVQVYETGETEYFVYGIQLCNDQADTGTTIDCTLGTVEIAGLAADIESGSTYPQQFYGSRNMTPLLQM